MCADDRSRGCFCDACDRTRLAPKRLELLAWQRRARADRWAGSAHRARQAGECRRARQAARQGQAGAAVPQQPGSASVRVDVHLPVAIACAADHATAVVKSCREVWRAVPAVREQKGWEHLRPPTVAAHRPISVLMQYLGGYSLYPRKTMTQLAVEFDGYGVSLKSGGLHHAKAFVPWADMTGIAVDGVLDAQRQRSLARTVEFGVLGGLAGKKVKSSYLMVGIALGDLIFHAEKMTALSYRQRSRRSRGRLKS